MKHIIMALLLGMASHTVAVASSPEYIALADSADNYMSRELWSDAENSILSALRLEPANFSNSLLLSNLGVARTHLGRYDDALEAYGLGLSIAPKSSVIYTNRARTLLQMGRYSEALTDLDTTLAIDSVQAWPLRMRGLLLLAADDTEGARKDFMTLSRHHPSDAGAMNGLAKIAEKENNYLNALKYYDESLKIEEDPDTRFSIILTKINLEKYSEAGEDIRTAMDKYPQNPDFFLLRGYLHKLNFRNQEADLDKKMALSKGADPKLVEQLLP